MAAVKASYPLWHAIAKNKFKNISLTRNTVAGRVNEIASNLRGQLRGVAMNFEVFSIAIDESNDATDIAHLAVFIRGCDGKMKITEELFEVIPMHGTTIGDDIFDALMIAIKKYDLPMKNFMSLATDCTPAMMVG